MWVHYIHKDLYKGNEGGRRMSEVSCDRGSSGPSKVAKRPENVYNVWHLGKVRK